MRHKANQFVSLLLALLFVLSVTACSNKVEDSSTYDEYETESDVPMDSSSEYIYDLEELEAEDALDFVNGKAWVAYKKGGSYDQLICIDDDGKELFTTTTDLTPVYASPFYDDTAFIIYDSPDGQRLPLTRRKHRRG